MTRFEQIVVALQSADRTTAQREWSEFERLLLGHLEWEEQHPLPQFDTDAVSELLLIRQDHTRIRGFLREFGRQIGARRLPTDRTNEFLALLRTHAVLEERMLDRWSATKTVADHQHAVPQPFSVIRPASASKTAA